MNVLYQDEYLFRLLMDLRVLTDIRANIFDVNGKDLQLTADHVPFCRLINATEEGHARCEACDARAVERCTRHKRPYSYRCHARLRETLLPIYNGSVPVAYMVFGQMLDNEGSMEQRWEETRRTLDWYPGDMEELKEAFFQLRRYSEKELSAYADLLEAVASYIDMRGIIRSAEDTDLQKLERYLDQHYMEKLSLATISAELKIGRTKLCALAKQLSGEDTLSRMIARRRVEAAKTLLLRSGEPISSVAEAVGISDYNYFSKVFRNITGMTPSAFRKLNQARNEEK